MVKRYLFIIILMLLAAFTEGASFIQHSLLVQQPTSTISANGTTSLIATSNQTQILTGSLAQTFKMADATTIPVGTQYNFIDDATGALVVNDNSNTQIITLRQGQIGSIWLTSNPSASGVWESRVETPEAYINVNNILGLGTDFATQYLTVARGDARYYTKSQYINVYSGLANQPVLTNPLGLIDISLFPPGPGAGTVITAGNTTDNAIAKFKGTNSMIIQNSGVLIDSSNNITGPNAFVASGNITTFGSYKIASSNAIQIPAVAPTSFFGGTNSGSSIQSGGDKDTGFGYNALSTTTTGFQNTVIGSGAGQNIIGGNGNVAVGTNAGQTITSGASNILIGSGIDVPLNNTSNYLSIGNLIYGNMSTGNVGIGTSTPIAALHVSQPNAAAAGRFDFYTATNPFSMFRANGTPSAMTQALTGDTIGGFAGFGANNSTGFNSGPSARMRFLAAENMTNTSRGADIVLETTQIAAGTGIVERMRVLNKGFVGINNTAPTAVLQMQSPAASTAATASQTMALITNDFTSSVSSTNKIGLDIESTGTWNGASAVNTGLVVNTSGGTTNYAATFSGGNVGIGQTSPASTLDLNGSLNVTGTATLNSVVLVESNSVTTPIAGRLALRASTDNHLFTKNPAGTEYQLDFGASNATANQVYAGPNGTSGVPGFRGLISADLPASVVYATQANTYTAGPQSIGATANSTQATNDTVTGTIFARLAKIATGNAIVISTADTTGILGVVVAGAGKAGSADIAQSGQAFCQFDGGVTQGDYVQSSITSAGFCHDAGATYPTSGQILGRVFRSFAGSGFWPFFVYGPEIRPGGSSSPAVLIANNVNTACTAGNPITSWAAVVDTTGTFNGTTFTAPNTGYYMVSFMFRNTGVTTNFAQVYQNGTLKLYGGTTSVSGSIVVGGLNITAGDAITVEQDGTGTFNSTSSQNVWTIMQVH